MKGNIIKEENMKIKNMKKKMKRMIFVSCAISLVLALTACSSTSTDDSDDEFLILDSNTNYYAELDVELTNEHFENISSLEELFGPSLKELGSKMLLNDDGSIEYYIGEVKAEGTWTVNENFLDFDLVDKTEGEKKINYRVETTKRDGEMYLLMCTSMGNELDDNGETMYWRLHINEDK